MIINEQYKIATEILYDDAHLWIEECIDEIQSEMTFSEKRAWITARNNGFIIQVGEEYREYQWEARYDSEYSDNNPHTIIEMPALHKICVRLKLYYE